MRRLQVSKNIRNVRHINTGDNEICLAKYTDDKETFAAGFKNGNICLYNLTEFAPSITLADEQTKDQPVTGISFRKGCKKCTITCSYENGKNGIIKEWNYLTGKCNWTSEEERRYACGLVYLPQYPKFLSYGSDGKIFMYDEHTRQCEHIYEICKKPKKPQKITCVAFNPQRPNLFLSGGEDKKINYWDLREGNVVRQISNVPIGKKGIAINAAGTEFVTCELKNSKQIRHWEYSSAKLVQSLSPEDGADGQLRCGKYLIYNMLATGALTRNTFRIIDLIEGITVSSVKQLPSVIKTIDILHHKKPIKDGDRMLDVPNILLACSNDIYEFRFR